MLTEKQKEILERASEIIKDKEEEKAYIDTCLKAGLCPKCGSSITFYTEYKMGKEYYMYKCESKLCESKHGIEY